MAPSVSVLIGIYNNASTLERAAASILGQTLKDLELILIDDGSTDDSEAKARELAASDARVHVLTMPRNVGISASLNDGLRLAQAPLVAIQDADDFSAPERLARQQEVLHADPEVAVVGCRMWEVDEQCRPLRPRTRFAAGEVGARLMAFNPIPNGSAMIRRDVALAAGGYDCRYRYAMEYDLWLRLADRWSIVALDHSLATRVMHPDNVAATAERDQTAEVILIRARTLLRRRTVRGASRLVVPAVAWATPPHLKRTRRRLLGQAP